MNKHLLHFLALATPLFAQNGDREEHDNMADIVPESLIPPAPVLSVEQALETFKLAPGFTIEPVAAEPFVDKPVALSFDPAGRMWICELRGYMADIDGSNEDKPMGRITILEDTNQDGQVDKRTVFLDKLLLPRSIAVVEGGIIFGDQNKLYYQASKNDKPHGEMQVIDAGYAEGGNVEHKSNGLLPALDNWFYNAKSDARYRLQKGKWIKEKTSLRGQWGLSMDNYGRLYYNNNSILLQADQLMPNLLHGNKTVRKKPRFDARLGSNAVFPSRVNPGLNRAYISSLNGYDTDTIDPKTYKLTNTTGACGPVVYRGTNYPSKMHGWTFVCESCVGLVKAIKIDEKDGLLTGSHPLGEKEFLTSTDERFRPVNLYNAPDGTLYLLDMYHGIIQHKTYMTSYLRRQTLSRGLDGPGLGHGRIYRIRYEKQPTLKVDDYAKASNQQLVTALAHKSGWNRDTAQQILIQRADPSVVPLLQQALTEKTNHLKVIHALWTLEGLNLLTPADIEKAFSHKNEKILISATTASLSLLKNEQAKLLPSYLKLPDSPAILPYKIHALASLPIPSAHEAVARLLKRKNKFARDAAISGMSKTAQLHLDTQKPTDKKLLSALKQTIKGLPKEIAPKTYLKEPVLSSFFRGKELYHGRASCIGCHGKDGSGVPYLGPIIDGSDWVTGDDERLTKILLHGLGGPIKINGKLFTPLATMPGLVQNPSINDQDLADIITYIRSAWSNRADSVEKEKVSQIRAATSKRAGRLYTQADFPEKKK